MSDQTKVALDAAIEAHMADEYADPAMLCTGWILQASGNGLTDDDSRSAVMYAGKTDMSMLTAQGLLAFVTQNVNELTWGDE